ncbi:uracil-DNA glycosylase [Malaciobacter marinus]|uniref:Uracil-DNA glycosylase n=1 Tax=Malaciobacter marinus TaxID=505249 RepID=A0ABX4LX70_9BACT|nr:MULTISPECIES: uracil-DNA glycosylase [Malaciobacter]PHO12106.1 uracil-DNA glycosylase [Malaciobacter marinus]PHO15187.1 uracil-DNA glycosylase [Malaciobacter marinus]RYA22769.1 uracil-DNA glycosylase [Malaciobacter halophilus]
MEERIVCQKCLYYYVTWEKERPHGCKAYGFKSQLIPSIVVKNSSGKPCSFYNPKQR